MVVAHTPRVGTFSKRKAKDLFLRPFIVILTLSLVLVYACGMITGMFWGRTVATGTAFTALILCTIAVWLMLRRVDAFMEKFSRRRLALLRGAEAEAYNSLLLRDNLDNNWQLWDNLKLDANSDIDHVLIGPAGFFVISTKSQRGRFILNGPNGPELNGHPEPWCNDVTRQAMRLRDQLSVIERDTPMPWIQTILCLPFAHIEPRDPKTHRATCGTVWVVNEDDLIEAVEEWSERKTRLAKPAREKWAAAVGRLAVGSSNE